MESRVSVLVVLALGFVAALLQSAEGGMPPSDGYYYDDMNMEMNMCPMMDCSFLEFMLPCSAEDRYVPRVMMYGVMCDACPQCHDYSYYRSLLSSTIEEMQEMFERTLIMQNFLDDNANILANIEELQITPDVVDAFQDLLQRNLATLREYSMYNALGVIDNLQATADKLTQLLEGSNGESMSDILNDHTPIQMTMLSFDSVYGANPTSIVQLVEVLQQLINELSRRHVMIKKVIEEETPILRTMLALPEEDFQSLWDDDRTTARVAFKLLEKSQEAIQSLLEMNMDRTGSSLQRINQEAETALLSIWEATANDNVGGATIVAQEAGNPSENPIQKNADGNGDIIEGSGEIPNDKSDTIIQVETNTLTKDNNLFFQWLSSRYMNNSETK